MFVHLRRLDAYVTSQTSHAKHPQNMRNTFCNLTSPNIYNIPCSHLVRANNKKFTIYNFAEYPRLKGTKTGLPATEFLT